MNRTWFSRVARSLLAAASFITLGGAPAAAQTEIVLHARNASRVAGGWQVVADGTAAGSQRMSLPDRGQAKLSSASASPTDYIELTFSADAFRPYRLWIRGKAQGNSYTNDSIFVQFSNSVDAKSLPVNRIGTTKAEVVSIEACAGCGLSEWGWEDNAYGGNGLTVYFGASGTQTIRIQRREDGISIDQIVLSWNNYYYSAPGSTKNDNTILSEVAAAPPAPTPPPTPPAGSGDIVLTTADATAAAGNWRTVADATAAGGTRYWIPDAGLAKVSTAAASPADYVDFTFTAEGGRPYRLWMRGKADNNSWANDSAFVQFSGASSYRIGTTSATVVSIEDCSGCGLSGWGWADNGYGSDGATITFAASGTQTLRVQRREDGLSFDQIVLSPQKYLSAAPGATKNDTTILDDGGDEVPAPAPPPPPAPEPEPPAGGPVKMRVLQWNLHHGVGTDGVYNLERIVTWMANLQPDVVMLNEVEKYTYWGNEDQPARIKARLEQLTGRPYYSHFIQEFGQWSSNGKGHQILSVYPFDSVGYTTTTPSSGLKWAGAIGQATITVNNRNINLFVGHLDPYDQAMRLIQAREVIQWASGFAENRIVAGDMNAWPDQSSILEYYKTYNDSWTLALNAGRAYANAAITPYGATKNGRIDYILLSKNAANLVVLESQVYDTRDASGIAASDHRPVVTTLEVR